MKTTVELDASNRIVLSRELRQAAGIPRRQKLTVSATPGRIQGPPPALGQHTIEILGELGYSPDDARALKEKRVVNFPA